MVPAARRAGAFAATQSWRRTAASTSTKVGSASAYHAACRVRELIGGHLRSQQNGQAEEPSRQRVVRPTARALHCRGVWKPRWARTSAKVTSTSHRLTYQAIIWDTDPSWSVQERAKGCRLVHGSRRSTQRRGSGGAPARCHRAVPVARSRASCCRRTSRSPLRPRRSGRRQTASLAVMPLPVEVMPGSPLSIATCAMRTIVVPGMPSLSAASRAFHGGTNTAPSPSGGGVSACSSRCPNTVAGSPYSNATRSGSSTITRPKARAIADVSSRVMQARHPSST